MSPAGQALNLNPFYIWISVLGIGQYGTKENLLGINAKLWCPFCRNNGIIGFKYDLSFNFFNGHVYWVPTSFTRLGTYLNCKLFKLLFWVVMKRIVQCMGRLYLRKSHNYLRVFNQSIEYCRKNLSNLTFLINTVLIHIFWMS